MGYPGQTQQTNPTMDTIPQTNAVMRFVCGLICHNKAPQGQRDKNISDWDEQSQASHNHNVFPYDYKLLFC
jgi:hypothetical protein